MLLKAISWLRNIKCVHIGFTSILIRKSSSQDIDSALMSLQNDLKLKENKVKLSSILQHLETVSPNWPHLLQGQTLLASVVHNLQENSDHCNVNFLVDYLLGKNYKMWGGLSTIILKSYIEQKSWKRAVSWFEDSKQEIKHLRVYNYMINSLVESNMLKLGYHYFQEVQWRELNNVMTTRRKKYIHHNTLLQLLQCVSRKSEKVFHDYSDDYMKTSDVKDVKEIVHSVINYIEMWGESVPSNLVNMLGTVLRSTQMYNVSFTSETGLTCVHCNSSLLINDGFSDICNSVATGIRNHMLEQGWDDELEYLDKHIASRKYFDIIIDGANTLGHTSHPGKLKRIVKYFSGSRKQMALVLPHTLHKQIKLDFIDEVHVFNAHDDLVVLYLAAKSEIFLQKKGGNVLIVSNDNYRDFWKIVQEDKHKVFNWLHHRQKNFDKEGNIKTMKNIQPVVRNDKGDMHLISKHGHICCVEQL